MADPKGAGKASKSYGVNLSGEGKSSLRILASSRKDGSVSVFAKYTVRDADGKVVSTKKGASSTVATLELGKKAVDKIVAQALSQGWQRKRGGGGRTAQDAFDVNSLPKPSAK